MRFQGPIWSIVWSSVMSSYWLRLSHLECICVCACSGSSQYVLISPLFIEVRKEPAKMINQKVQELLSNNFPKNKKTPGKLLNTWVIISLDLNLVKY